MKLSKLLVLFFTVFVLSACINRGNQMDYNKVSSIQRNVTTEAQIRAMFGEPVSVETNHKANRKVLQYVYKNDDSIKKTGAAILGAIAGGLLGSNIGGGTGTYVATTVGTGVGGALAENMVDAREEQQVLEVVIALNTGRVIDYNFTESKGRTQAWGINGGVDSL